MNITSTIRYIGLNQNIENKKGPVSEPSIQTKYIMGLEGWQEMDYYKATEKYLYNYNSLKASVQNMQQELKKDDYKGAAAIRSKEVHTSKTNAFHSATEEEAIANIDKKDLIIQRINLTMGKIERIDRAISALNAIEKQIITERYINGKQWWQVAYTARYNERWCKEIRRRAIGRIAIGLFGEEAMHEHSTNRARLGG